MSTAGTNRVGALAIIGAASLWGTTGTAASFFPDDVNPLAIGAVTMVGGGILLFLVSFRRARVVLGDKKTRRWLILGALAVFVYPLAFYSSMDLAGIAVGNVVSLGTGPVFAALLERTFERARLSLLWKITTSVALLGVLLLALAGSLDGREGVGVMIVGVVLGLIAGLSYATYTYCSTRVIRAGHTSGATIGAIFGTGAAGLFPVVLVLGGPLLQSGATIGIASYLIVGPMFVAYLIFGIGLRATSSSTATTITLIEPVIATMLAVTIVGELLNPTAWLGLVLIFVAITALSTASHPRKLLVST